MLDEKEFIVAAEKGALPAVAFVKPIGELNEHPGYANVLAGEQHTEELINRGSQWIGRRSHRGV